MKTKLDTSPQNILGKLLRNSRRESGVSLKALASDIQISDASILYIEAGNYVPKPSRLDSFAKVLRIDREMVLRAAIETELRSLCQKYRVEIMPIFNLIAWARRCSFKD